MERFSRHESQEDAESGGTVKTQETELTLDTADVTYDLICSKLIPGDSNQAILFAVPVAQKLCRLECSVFFEQDVYLFSDINNDLVDGVRLRVLTSATNGPIVLPPR
jgi:hypothetical protein